MAIRKEIWDKAKALFEQGLSLADIHLETNIDRSSISKRAKKENWQKAKNQQLKVDIKGIEEDNSTLKAKINTTVEKLSKLSDFEITILNETIEDETGNKALVFSNANLALIRSNQQLTKGTKTAMTKVKTYDKEGRVNGETIELYDIALDSKDIKEHTELTDKASITLGVNQRHATAQQINNTNAQQTNNNLTVEYK